MRGKRGRLIREEDKIRAIGLIKEGCSADSGTTTKHAGCETTLIWSDLSTANMIEGAFTSADDSVQAISAGSLELFFPRTKIGQGAYVTVYSDSGRNYYEITGITSIDASGIYTLTGKLTPQDAYSIDSKVDDGKPLAGIVQGTDCWGAGRTPPPCTTMHKAPSSGQGCITGTAYDTSSATYANSPGCLLRMNFN